MRRSPPATLASLSALRWLARSAGPKPGNPAESASPRCVGGTYVGPATDTIGRKLGNVSFTIDTAGRLRGIAETGPGQPGHVHPDIVIERPEAEFHWERWDEAPCQGIGIQGKYDSSTASWEGAVSGFCPQEGSYFDVHRVPWRGPGARRPARPVNHPADRRQYPACTSSSSSRA